MKIGYKMTLAFLTVALLVAVVGSVGIFASNRVAQVFHQVEKHEIPRLIASLEIQSAARQASIKALEYSLRRTASDKAKAGEALAKIDSSLLVLINQVKNPEIKSNDYVDVINAAMPKVDVFKDKINGYLAKVDQGLTTQDIYFEEQDVHLARREMVHALYDVISRGKQELFKAVSLTQERISDAIKIILNLCLLSIAFAALIGILMTLSIVRPLAKIKEVAVEVGKGNLDRRIDINRNDEIGQLAVCFNDMACDLSAYRKKTENLLQCCTLELNSTREQLQLESSVRERLAEELNEYRFNLEELVIKRTAELEKALAEIKILSGFIPICASCKKIRDDQGFWNQIESYLRAHSNAQFSHGICPDCAKKLYPDLDNE